MTIEYFETREAAEMAAAHIREQFPNVNIQPIAVIVTDPPAAARRYGMRYYRGPRPFETSEPLVHIRQRAWILSDERGEMPTEWDGRPLANILPVYGNT
jgi:hypothetical protein